MKYFSFAFILALPLLLPKTGETGWVKQTSNTTLPLNDVCFVDSLYGWAVGGYYHYPNTTAWVVLRTTDGGNNWINAWQTSGVGVLETVTFINRLHGWALADSSIFLESTDGGVSWHYQPAPSPRIYFLAERFVNDTLGYMLFFVPDWMGIMDGSNVAWTTDGGLTWEYREPRAQQPAFLLGLDVCGPNWTWAVGWKDSMVLTRDAATNWSVNYLPGGLNPWYCGVAFGDTLIGVAVGGVGEGLISRTTDGGFTWTQMYDPVSQSLNSAAMPDPGHAWGCGYGGSIIASTDGGQNWAAQSSGTRLILNEVWFVDSLQGWAVGDSGVILHTDNGGWTGITQEPSTQLTSYASRFMIKPNPFISYAIIPGHEVERFALYDITGRRVGTYKGERVGWDMSPGVYFVRAVEGKGALGRIVKIR